MRRHKVLKILTNPETLAGEDIHGGRACGRAREVEAGVLAGLRGGHGHEEDRVPGATAPEHARLRGDPGRPGRVGLPPAAHVRDPPEIHSGLLPEPQRRRPGADHGPEDTLRLRVPVPAGHVVNSTFISGHVL